MTPYCTIAYAYFLKLCGILVHNDPTIDVGKLGKPNEAPQQLDWEVKTKLAVDYEGSSDSAQIP
jgi:hypothetical protein